jgi:hypothetical protein
MDDIVSCPTCHTTVRPTDYFCFNCGKDLHPKPPSMTLERQIMLYLGSFFLPPMGIIWGLRYVRVGDTKSKTVGYVAMAITVVVILLYAVWITNVMNNVSQQINQFQNLQGF